MYILLPLYTRRRGESTLRASILPTRNRCRRLILSNFPNMASFISIYIMRFHHAGAYPKIYFGEGLAQQKVKFGTVVCRDKKCIF